jgi:hypothetical protein
VGLPWDISARCDKWSLPNTPHKHRRGVEVELHSFLISGIDGVVWSTPRPGRFTPGKSHGTHCTGGWVGPGAGLMGVEKHLLPARGFELRIHSAHIESLCLLYNPGRGPHFSLPLRPTAVTAVSRGEGLSFAVPPDKYYTLSTAQLEPVGPTLTHLFCFSAWPGWNLGRYTVILYCHLSGIFCSPFR